jgi:hypothetical protein
MSYRAHRMSLSEDGRITLKEMGMFYLMRTAGEVLNEIVIVGIALFFPIVILLAIAGH